MFGFIVLLSFGGSWASTCTFLNNESCKARPTTTDLNPVELKYYLFMISLDKCTGGCNSVEDLFTKICIPNKKKQMLKYLIRKWRT